MPNSGLCHLGEEPRRRRLLGIVIHLGSCRKTSPPLACVLVI
jgi:hypothetical protein